MKLNIILLALLIVPLAWAYDDGDDEEKQVKWTRLNHPNSAAMKKQIRGLWGAFRRQTGMRVKPTLAKPIEAQVNEEVFHMIWHFLILHKIGCL